MTERFLREFKCVECGKSAFRDLAQCVALLRAHGMLRRVESPEPLLVEQLLQSVSHAIACRSCGAGGPSISPAVDEFDLPEARTCQKCKCVILPERLEVFPDATHCAACQGAGESEADESEFCPRCGGRMAVRATRGSTLARYAMTCSDCGAKFS